MSRLLRSMSLYLMSVCQWNRLQVSLKAVSSATLFALLSVGIAQAQDEFTCELSITCPSDVTVECGTDLEDLSITGLPVVDQVNCDGEVVLTHSDDVQSGDDCTTVLIRTWTVSIVGGPSDVCTQMITVQDTQGPVFINAPESISYQCAADVPAPATVIAEDACSGASNVVGFGSETGQDTLFCTLSTPVGPGPDWAVWLNGLTDLGLASNDYYRWAPGATSMTYYDDGTAYLTGTVQNMTNPSETWEVHFWMQNGRNWDDWSALGRSYKNDLGFGTATHTDWTYYELVPVFSHFVGTGANAGNELYLSHQPANYYFGFQFGQGANNRNGNDGGSGWFYYWGWVDGEYVDNHGDLTVDKECVPVENPNEACLNEFSRMWYATDACGNITMHEQIISIQDTEAPVFVNCPSDVTAECGGEIPGPVDASTLEAIDNCNGPVTITYLGSGTEVVDECSYTIIHQYQATDTCGNWNRCEYFVHVLDTTAPELTVPADATFECDEEIVYASASAMDLCQGQVAVSEGESQTIQNECGYTIIRYFYATDICQNTAQGYQTITVVDSTPPVFDAFDAEISVECDEIASVAILTASDNCDLEVDVDYSDEINSGGCLGVIMRTYTATDDCGNTANAVQYITITDTTPATIDEPADQTVECDAVPAAPGAEGASVTDNCEGAVTVEFHTETIEGECANSYTILWIWEAWDYCENYSTDTTVITVVDTTAPVLEVPAGGTFSCDEDIVYGEASASDNCDDQVEIGFSDAETPGDCPAEYMVVRTWTATDNCGNTSTASATYYVVDDNNPYFTSVPENITIECDEAIPATDATAADACSDVVVAQNDVWEVSGPCYSMIVREFTATDACGNVATAFHTITILDTTAPVIEYTPEIDLPCDNYSGIYATATDNCDEEVEVFWVGDEEVSGSCQGRIMRTYGAYDQCENYSEVVQIINLVDEVDPTVVDQTPDMTVECGSPMPEVNVEFDDNCDNDLDVVSGVVVTEDGCNLIYTYTFTATDNCFNSVSANVVVTVVDTTDPYFEELPSDITIQCYEEVPGIVVPVAYDLCDEFVDVEVSDDVIAGDCPNEYSIARVYRAYDDCGNEVVETRYIYVVDLDAPVFGEQENEYAYECDEEIPVIEPIAEDACGETTLTHEDNWIDDSNCTGYMIRTWTAEDDCGNISTFDQYISVNDETAPVITGEIEITMPCDNISQEILVSATDNCDLEVDLSIWSDELSSGGCAGVLIRVYRAYDECGNFSEFTQYITLVDDQAPVASITPENATYECDEEWAPASVSFTDNCDDELTLLPDLFVEQDECTTVYHYVWTAIDHCDNVTTVEQYITVTDTTAPVASFDPEDFTVECGQFWDLVIPVFTDNCDEELTLDNSVEETMVDCATVITYTWSATDDCGNTTTVGNTVTIVDTTPPSLIVPEDASYSCEDSWEFGMAMASDICDEEVVITFSDITTDGDCPQSYQIERTWVAVDDCGNTTTASATVTVYDETAPEFTFVPEEITIECSDEIPASSASAEDNCDLQVEVSQSDSWYAQGDCYSAIIRTFTATDDCGNSSTATQWIYIVDTTAPVFAGEFEISMPCDDIQEGIFVSATDNCDEEVYIEVLSDVMASGSCAGRIIRTYRAWDNCENFTDFVQFINLTDDEAPVASVTPENMTVECGQPWAPAEVTFTDNCDQELSLFPDLFVTTDDCSTTYTYTWMAIDHCENVTVVEQTITVVDTTAPVIDAEDSESTVACNVIVDFIVPSASDLCDEQVEVVPTYLSVDGDCPGEYTEYYTFTATDDCGNSSSVTYTVHHVDEEAPMLENIPSGGQYSCDDILPTDEPSAFDYCSEATVYSSETILPGECPQSYIVVRTFWAQDECGNTSDEVEVSYYVSDNDAPEFTSVPTDEYYECLDWSTYTPQALAAIDNCGEVTIDVSIQAEESDECGNGIWVVAYAAFDECDNYTYTSYTVSVYDESAPVLSETPSDLMLDCGDELPAAPEVSATDNCDTEVLVSFTETCLGDCPEEGSQECEIQTPVRPAGNPCNYPVDWAMALFGMPSAHKWYQLQSGELVTNANGSLTVSGVLVNAYNVDCGFTFNVTFANPMEWAEWSNQAFPTGFKADCGGLDDLHEEWIYYLLQAGEGAELIGWGCYEGSALNLTHAPSNNYFGFQYGEGANNYNAANGLGGWFAYSGVFLVDGEPIMSGMAAGAGDFAFEVDCCPDYQIVRCWTAVDCTGNETSWCQTITFGDLNTDVVAAPSQTEQIEERESIAIVGIMPNPANEKAQISFISDNKEKLSLQILDITGRVIADLFNGVVEAGVVYRADFDANVIPNGIYMVRLNSANASDIDRIQIAK